MPHVAGKPSESNTGLHPVVRAGLTVTTVGFTYMVNIFKHTTEQAFLEATSEVNNVRRAAQNLSCTVISVLFFHLQFY